MTEPFSLFAITERDPDLIEAKLAISRREPMEFSRMSNRALVSFTVFLVSMFGFAASAGALAADAQPQGSRAGASAGQGADYSSTEFTISELLAVPAVRAIFERHVPGFTDQTFRRLGITDFRMLKLHSAPFITDAHLAEIARALAAGREATKTLFLGKWRPADRSCDVEWISFNNDGRVRNNSGGTTSWQAHGGELISIGENFEMPFQTVSRDHVIIRQFRGRELVLHRCPAEPRR